MFAVQSWSGSVASAANSKSLHFGFYFLVTVKSYNNSKSNSTISNGPKERIFYMIVWLLNPPCDSSKGGLPCEHFAHSANGHIFPSNFTNC